MRNILMTAVAAAAMALPAAELPGHVQFFENGSFRVADAEFFIQAYNGDWAPTLNTAWKNRKGKSAAMVIGDRSGLVSYEIKPLAENEFEVDFSVKFPQPVLLNSLHGVLMIPAGKGSVTVDGKTISLPENEEEMTVYRDFNAKKLALCVAGGNEISFRGEPLQITIQDNRKFGESTFAIRFAADPGSGEIAGSSLKLRVKTAMLKTSAVDLAGSANLGFRDEVANDGKGGWTDQGPDNDLRMLKPGAVAADAIRFNVTGKAVILAGSSRNFATRSIELAFPANAMKAVNLLHASAWTPENDKLLGRMAIRYADGSEEIIPVMARRDCGNWWNPIRYGNAAIAWTGENPEARVGLYASSFPLKKAGPESVRFEILDSDSVWMIAGVTLSERAVKFSALDDKPIVFKENFEWKKLNFNRETVAGSPLDFSFLNDAPAGRHGRIVVADGGTLTFEKANGKRVRLYGANLCFSANYLTREAADKAADEMVKCGYNSVRFHHHDTMMLDGDAGDSLTLNPGQMDQFDYLFAAMKKRGIYITTDLCTNRAFRPGDNIPECDFYDQWQMKALIPLSRASMENWKEFVRRFMNHKNPYTGMTWGEDPALYCINLINEETLTGSWNTSPSSIKLYRTAFAEYLKAKKLPESACANNNPVFIRFLNELQGRVLDEQIRFIKEELKLKTLLTSLNYVNDVPLTLLRDKFDVVDNHAYFDHPGFVAELWRAPFSYKQNSAIARMALVPRNMMPTRIPGKPFLVTEFNYCNPNLYRAEGGPLIGAYGALQNWDALYRFAWSHDANALYTVGAAYGFDAANDPMAQLSDRIAIAMFLRGDVKAAEHTYAYAVSPENTVMSFPDAFGNLGLITGIGSIPADAKTPQNVTKIAPAAAAAAALNNGKLDALWRDANEKKLAASVTGELLLDGNRRTFTVKTPLTETVTLEKGSLRAGTLGVEKADVWQTVAAISLDGKELSQSASVLIIHLTNVVNTGLTFTNETKTIVPATGMLPLLIQKGSAEISLATTQPFRVTALKADGSPNGEVKGELKNGSFRFTANTALLPGGVMAYHLTR